MVLSLFLGAEVWGSLIDGNGTQVKRIRQMPQVRQCKSVNYG